MSVIISNSDAYERGRSDAFQNTQEPGHDKCPYGVTPIGADWLRGYLEGKRDARNPQFVASAIAREARRFGDASWALTAAMSGQRKAVDGSYRNGPHGDSGSGGRGYVPLGPTVEEAARDALRILIEAGVTL